MITGKSNDKNLLEILARINQEINAAEELLKSPLKKGEGAQEAVIADTSLPEMEEKTASIEKFPHPSQALPMPESNFIVSLDNKETDFIIEKVEKINRDDEMLRRLNKVEIRVRRITLLTAMFITFQVLTLSVVIFLLSPAKYWVNPMLLSRVTESSQIKSNPIDQNQEFTISKHEPDSSQPGVRISPPESSTLKPEQGPSQQVTPAAQVSGATSQKSSAKPAAEDAKTKGSGASALAVTESTSIYVGSRTSNKYHYPKCKWAKTIRPEKVVTFKSAKEAQEAGYVPCPVCKPPLTD
jgi:hypothetical protein